MLILDTYGLTLKNDKSSSLLLMCVEWFLSAYMHVDFGIKDGWMRNEKEERVES